MFRKALVLGLLTVACPMMGGCTLEDGTAEESVGSVSVMLLGASPDGTQYRLRNAVFNIDAAGTEVLALSTETDPDATALTTDLPRGNYGISLAPGWTIEDVASGQQVAATLLSRNDTVFTIADGAVASVAYRFKVLDQVVVVGGSLNVSAYFDESAACEEDVFEPNDTEAQAIDLFAAGYPLPAAVCGDEDWWTIRFPEGSVGEQAKIVVTLDHALGDLDAYLHQPDGTLVRGQSTTDPEELPFVKQTGLYRLRVVGFMGASNKYTIDLVETPAAP